MQTYARQGGTSSIFINDDGLQLLKPDERDARLHVARIGPARVAVELLGPIRVAERDAEVGRIDKPARAFRRVAFGRVDDQRDRLG